MTFFLSRYIVSYTAPGSKGFPFSGLQIKQALDSFLNLISYYYIYPTKHMYMNTDKNGRVGSSALHVVGFYYVLFNFLVTLFCNVIIHILANNLTYFFLKSFFLCYLLSLSESFFLFYYLVWFQT